MPVPVPTFDQLVANPELARTLPRPACIAVLRTTSILHAEAEARLAELDVPAPMTPVAGEAVIDLRETAAMLGWKFNTLRQTWQDLRGLVECRFAGSHRPKFVRSKVEAYIKRGGEKPLAARRGIGRR